MQLLYLRLTKIEKEWLLYAAPQSRHDFLVCLQRLHFLSFSAFIVPVRRATTKMLLRVFEPRKVQTLYLELENCKELVRI